MTKRKEDMARVAEALGVPLVQGETTGELSERCAERAEELRALLEAREAENDRAELEAERAERSKSRVPAEPAPEAEAPEASVASRPRTRRKRSGQNASPGLPGLC